MPAAANPASPAAAQSSQQSIPGIPMTLNLNQQRLNNHDRIQYSSANPFKIKKDKGSRGAKTVKSNVITRFAYSTREGFSVHNANKKNQDNFILAPNMCQTFH